MNFCSSAVISQRLLCTQKAGIKCELKLSCIQNILCDFYKTKTYSLLIY